MINLSNLKSSAKWKWLLEAPLSPTWRGRLELCLGVVISGAAVVALSTTIRPDPSRLAELHPAPLLQSSPRPPWMVDGSDAYSPKPMVTTELMQAVRDGDVDAMTKNYSRGMPLERMLSTAARSGKKAAVVWLLDHGANIHDDETSPDSPVLSADPYPEIVKLLRDRGAAQPSLEAAAAANAPNALVQLLDAHPKLSDGGSYLLQAAAASTSGTGPGKRIVISKLLEAGANPERTLGAESALGGAIATCDEGRGHESLASDCMTIVHLLLDHGAPVTGDALGEALSLGDDVRAAPLDALLARPIAKGVTATALARARSGNPQDLKRVVAKGIDWAWQDGEDDAALPVVAAVRRADRDFVRALLDVGAPVDVHFKDGSCALAEAIDASGNNPEQARIVELLVTRGANVNRRFPDGRTPLFAAAEAGDLRVVNFLLAKGARVNDLILDDTPLNAAEQNGHTPVARVLHAHGGHRAPQHNLMY